jgi:chaperonin cofactor prefoldin
MQKKTDKLKDFNSAISLVALRVNSMSAEVSQLTAQINSLTERRDHLLKHINQLIAKLEEFRGKKHLPKAPDFVKILSDCLPEDALRSNMKIGDAMELILSYGDPLTQKEIIERIRAAGIRLSEKAPYVVIGNIIRNDKEGRFERLKDGRVSTKKRIAALEKTQADAKR